MSPEDSSRHSNQLAKTTMTMTCVNRCRLLLNIIAVLSIIVIALIAYVIFKNVSDDDESTSSGPQHSKAMTKNEVLRIYGNFFKTPSELEEMKKNIFGDTNRTTKAEVKQMYDPRYYRHVCANIVNPEAPKNEPDDPSRPVLTPRDIMPDLNIIRPTTVPNDDNNNNNTENPEKRKRRSSPSSHGGLSFHGCCTSFQIFDSPDSAIDNEDRTTRVDLVYFEADPNDPYGLQEDERQYFLVDVCWHDSNCYLNCGCRQDVSLFNALVHNTAYDPDDEWSDEPPYRVATIRLPGFCKCMNNMRPTTWVVGSKG